VKPRRKQSEKDRLSSRLKLKRKLRKLLRRKEERRSRRWKLPDSSKKLKKSVKRRTSL